MDYEEFLKVLRHCNAWITWSWVQDESSRYRIAGTDKEGREYDPVTAVCMAVQRQYFSLSKWIEAANAINFCRRCAEKIVYTAEFSLIDESTLEAITKACGLPPSPVPEKVA